MNLYGFPEGQIIAFALVFLRIVAFVIAWPIFGTALVPVQVKIFISVAISMLMFPTLHFQNSHLLAVNDHLPFMAFRELSVGLAMGFLMRAFFFAVSVAGDIISISMGLASAQLYNPAMGSQGNVIEHFQVGLATLFFLAINGHHIFLGGLASSFELVPISALGIKYEAFRYLGVLGQEILLIGLKLSAPVLVSILITNVALGILGKAVPQINILVTSLPITITIGFFVMFVSTPLFIEEMAHLSTIMADEFFKMMKVL